MASDAESRGRHPDGTTYKGHFQAGKFDGQGTISMPDGKKWQGGFVAGQMSGDGIITLPNGQQVEGSYVDGKFTMKAAPADET